jgi:hypothetical protein
MAKDGYKSLCVLFFSFSFFFVAYSNQDKNMHLYWRYNGTDHISAKDSSFTKQQFDRKATKKKEKEKKSTILI